MALKLTKDEMSRLPEWAMKQIESQTQCNKKNHSWFDDEVSEKIDDFYYNLETFRYYNTKLYEIVVNKCIIDKEKGSNYLRKNYEGDINYRDYYASSINKITYFRVEIVSRAIKIFLFILLILFSLLFGFFTGPMGVGMRVYF